MSSQTVTVVDLGHTRWKRADFVVHSTAAERTVQIQHLSSRLVGSPDEFLDWLSPTPADLMVVAGSALDRVKEFARLWDDSRQTPSIAITARDQIPMPVAIEHPDSVGLDRLCNALAVVRRKHAHYAAVIITSGTALVVDAVSPDGKFMGGAIAPGLAVGARALSELTERLPRIDVADWPEAPIYPGEKTVDAMRAGLWFGHRGAARELLHVAQRELAPHSVDVFLTGGGANALMGLANDVQFVPELTLEGALWAALDQAGAAP
jgi:type III pantothenate kinase